MYLFQTGTLCSRPSVMAASFPLTIVILGLMLCHACGIQTASNVWLVFRKFLLKSFN